MQTQRLVLPADLNQYGSLFGGRLLAWVDEASWITASLEFPQCRFVTVAMRDVCFRYGVREGTILSIESTLKERGTTSVRYEVRVFDTKSRADNPIFITEVTFVNVDERGEKQAIPKSA